MTDSKQEARARNIIKRLKMFNRKERDYLMKFALCERPEAPRISTSLWEAISKGGTRPNPDAMFIGMDYHLNWLHAAIATADGGDSELEIDRPNEWQQKTALDEEDKNFRPIQRNQEDVDLLIVWFDQRWSTPMRLFLVEAKLDSSWSSEQFRRKKERLSLIREDAIDRGLDFIEWKFVLMSPGDAPKKNEFNGADSSERYSWLGEPKRGTASLFRAEHVALPVPKELRRVKRVSENSDKWTTESGPKWNKSDDGS